MKSTNIPEVKLGIIAVSRDCFPIALSTQRRENIVKAYKGELFNCQTTVENEKDMLKAVAEVKEAGCNALVVFLGNFGPETPETLIAKNFDGPCMFVAAAEGDGDMYASKVQIVCPRCKKPTRVAHKIYDDGSKGRVCAKCGEAL